MKLDVVKTMSVYLIGLSFLCFSSLGYGESLSKADYVWGWATLNLGGAFQEIAIDPHKPNICYAAADVGGFFKSEDEGNSWRMIDVGLETYPDIRTAGITPHPLKAGVVFGETGFYGRGGLYISADWGEHWKLLTRKIVFSSQNQYGKMLAFSHTDPNMFWAAADGGVYLTKDGGKTWKRLGFAGRCVRGVQVHPHNDDTLIVWMLSDRKTKKPGGIFISHNGGKTWSRISPQLKNVRSAEFCPHWPDVILAAADKDGLWRSTDGGKSFFSVKLYGCRGPAFDVDFSKVIKGRCYVAISSRYQGAQLYISNDYGKSWEPTTRFIGTHPLTVRAAIKSPNRVFLTDWNWIRVSDDGGLTFDRVPTGQEMSCGMSVAFGNPFEIFFGVYDFGSRASYNGGYSWRNINPGGRPEINYGYWVGNCLATDTRRSPTVVYLATFGRKHHIFKSYDAARSWVYLKREGRRIEGNYVGLHRANPDIVFVQTLKGDWLISVDGGNRWRDIGKWDRIKGPAGKPKTLFAVKNKKLYVSNDLGRSWNVLYKNAPIGYRFALNPKNGNEIMIATPKDILLSSDCGKTWKSIGKSLGADSHLAFGYFGRIFVGTGWSPTRLGLVKRSSFDIRMTEDRGKTWKTLIGCKFVGYELFDKPSAYRGETATKEDFFDGACCYIQGIFPDPYHPGRIFVPSSGNSLFVAQPAEKK